MGDWWREYPELDISFAIYLLGDLRQVAFLWKVSLKTVPSHLWLFQRFMYHMSYQVEKVVYLSIL